jgi:glycerol-3-phosphate acyltransferase PlsY
MWGHYFEIQLPLTGVFPMSISTALPLALIAYLIGSISFARLVARLAAGKDITQHEIPVEGTADRYKVISIGGNSVASMLGARAGLVTALGDILKIYLPTLACKLLYPGEPALVIVVALAGLLGHIYPIYYRFHGGSGFSAILGGLLVIDPLAALATPILGLLLGLFIFRHMVAMTLGWIWLLIPWFWFRTSGDPAHIVYAIAVNVLFILAMLPEAQQAMKYQKEGKAAEYGLGSLKAHPMGRGMLKMAKYFKIEIQ